MKILLILAGAAIVLTLVIMRSAPAGPGDDAPHTPEGAAAACRREVEARNSPLAFPFSPTAEYVADREYRVTGMADVGPDGARTRRNYECRVQYEGSGIYTADSVSVWQSH